MDLLLEKDGHWQRVKPEQAKKALAASGTWRTGLANLDVDELTDLLGGSY